MGEGAGICIAEGKKKAMGEGAEDFGYSVSHMDPFLWSKLPKALKEPPNVATFRIKIR